MRSGSVGRSAGRPRRRWSRWRPCLPRDTAPAGRGTIGFLFLLLLMAPQAGCHHDADSGGGVPAGESRPNVIFILTDDQAPGSLGFAGNSSVRTPHLDALAAEGVYFTRAYVPTPQCAPSRAAALTGQYPHVSGVLTNRGARLAPDVHTLPRALREQGYATGLVGKWHLGPDDRPQAGFEDLWVTVAEPGRYVDPELWVDGARRRHEGFLTDVLTGYAMRFITAHQDRPFFLWLAYRAPHPPFPIAPDAPFVYEADALPLPASITDDLSTKPAAQRDGACHAWFQRAARKQGAGLRQRLARYYMLVSVIDLNVGRLIERVRELGMADRTIVIYASDNGVLFGEHQMVTKGPAFYEELVRTPLLVWAPGNLAGGRRVEALTSLLDIFPTVCARAGCTVPAGLPGMDLWPLAGGQTAPAHAPGVREALFFEYMEKRQSAEEVPMRGLVTDRYKYAVYLDSDEEELYDLRDDPGEMKNLAGDEAHGDLVATMRRTLAAWRHRSGDDGP